MKYISVMVCHVSLVITSILAFYVMPTQTSRDLVGKTGFARWSDGKYYRGELVASDKPDLLRFRSVYGNLTSFNFSDWQAFAPDITPERKIISVGSRVISPDFNNDQFKPGTIVYIDSSHSTYKVHFADGTERNHTKDELRVLLQGFAVFGRDCLDLLHKGYSENGVYFIYPDGISYITAFCDQKTNGGGWIVFQRRVDGLVDFYLDWSSYKEGFGDFMTEFWLGNDDIHKITSGGSQLLIELEDKDSQPAHAFYGYFDVGTEAEKYVLHLSGFSGTEGDAMSATHNDMKFSTRDQDNDIKGDRFCAQEYTGAWWYQKCHEANLNGRYGDDRYAKGITWQTWKGYYYSLKRSAMKVKPRREQEKSYELIFSGAPSDYVLLPRITDLRDVTSCWWIKTEVQAGWSTIFALYDYDNTSVLSFSYHGNGSYRLHANNGFRTFDVPDCFITDGYWYHVCIAWFSSGGSFTFFKDGVNEAAETGLATNFKTGIGYMIIGGFEGYLTRFNMWDEYIEDPARIKEIACSSVLIGNVVPWPEVQLWRIGNVTKKNNSLWKISGFQSALVGHIPGYQDTLMSWLNWSVLCKRYWVPCFRGTVDGWQSQTFHSKCDNKGPTVTIARKDSYLFGGFADQSWKNHSQAQNIQSKKAFLFSLKPFNQNDGSTKFALIPEKADKAIRGDKNKGPCWGMDTQELCFTARDVNITPGGVFDDNGISNLDTFFTGESSFQADEVEVFVVADSMCDPPCGEHENCDEITGQCICDPAFREEEICRMRQELQDIRDKHCNARWGSTRSDCLGRLFARYDVTEIEVNCGWRCYYEDSLTGDRRRYDTVKASNCYHEDSGLALENFAKGGQCIAVGPKKRTNCGWTGITQNTCEVDRGCCYDAHNYGYETYLCFYATDHKCHGIAPSERVECGFYGITRETCESTRGCCYDSSVSGVPHCFHGKSKPGKNCKPLGMESLLILDSQISASSEYDAFHIAHNARLNLHAVPGIRHGSWTSLHLDINQWLQVDFKRKVTVAKVATQGRMDWDQWVTSYSLSYSMDGNNFQGYQQDSIVKVFSGNSDRNSVVYHELNPAIFTRFIRILPKAWFGHLSLRAEFYECDVKNYRPLGMESNFILDSQISASSEHSAGLGARNGRLNLHGVPGIRHGSWSSGHLDFNQWLQVDFKKTVTVAKVATQGRMDANQWVTSYSLSYSTDGNNFQEYQQSGVVKVFSGNADRNTVVYHELNPVIFTRYIRILPKTWHAYISMRAEFYQYDGNDVFEVDDLLSDSIYLWTFDDPSDIKDQQGESWAEVSGSLESTAGVRGLAVKASGGVRPVRLTEDNKGPLIYPASTASTLSLWILYQSKGPGVSQTFLAAGIQENGEKGTCLYQEDGNREELTFRLTSNVRSCSYKFSVPQRVWTHLVFPWHFVGGATVYRNGRRVTNVVKYCQDDSFINAVDEDIKLGTSQLPVALFDDIIVWGKKLSELQVEKLFRFYKGGANLHVNVSVEIIGETFHSDFLDKGSEIFLNKTSWLETQIKSLYDKISILKVDNFQFWSLSDLAVNFTVRFKGTGYKEIEPLETSLLSRRMLGSSPVRFVAMEANDVYIKPLKVIAYNTSSTSLAVSWNEPGNLTHGIFCGVEIFYRLNSSTEKFSVMVESLLPGHELTHLQPYTWYVITARPHTLEGEGKESEGILAITGEDVPTSHPINVNGFLNNSKTLIVTWEPVPVDNRRGIILGYHIMYAAQSHGNQQQLTVNAPSLSVVLQNLEAYTQYSITVAAFNTAGQGPPSPAIIVRSPEGVPTSYPVNVSGYLDNSEKLLVTWEPVPVDNRRGVILGYHVMYAAQSNGNQQQLSVNASNLSVELQNLETYALYNITVVVFNTAGQGPPSPAIVVRSPEGVPTSHPVNVSGFLNNSANLIVTWEPVPVDHRRGVILGYQVMYAAQSNGNQQQLSVNAPSLSVKLQNLETYTLYNITVAAFNAAGQGPPSPAIVVRSQEGVPTSHPVNVKGFLNNSKILTVTWEPVPVDHRRGVILGYQVMYAPQSNGNQQQLTVNAPSLSVGLQNLETYTLYSITVAAFNAAGQGPLSPAIVVRSPEGVPSLPPPIIMAHSTSFSSITVTWKAIPDEHVHGILDCYILALDGDKDVVYGCPSSLTTTIHGLEKSKVYKLKMAGCTSNGHGNFSEYVIVTTNIEGCRALGMENGNISDSQITASSKHNNLHAASQARLHYQGGYNGGATFAGSWSARGNDVEPWLQVDFREKVTVVKVATQGRFDRDQWVESYSLSYSHDGTHFEVYKQFGEAKVFQGNWDRNTVVYNVITPVISARFIRILLTTWGGSPFIWASMRAEFYTCDYDLKIDPVNITNTVPSSTSVGLSWQPPDRYKLGEDVSVYRVEIVDLLRGERFNYTVNSSNVELDFLKPFTNYEFKVFGSTSSWEGNITDTISLQTKEDAPSEPPRNLSVEHSTTSQATLQWKPVHEYFINGKLRGYKVKYKETKDPAGAWKNVIIRVNDTQQSRRKRSVSDDSVSLNLEDLKPYTTYTIIVLAFTVKDGVPTLATNFTTAEDVPDHPPTNVTAHNTSYTSINVTWQSIPLDHVNGILLGYLVIYRRVDKLNDNISVVMVNSTSLDTELTGLGKYKLYSIQVAGRTVAGVGNFSNPIFVRTEQDVPDDPPSNIRAIGTEPTVIQAYWLPVSNETVNGIALGYTLALFNTAGENIRNYTLNASVLSLKITGLEIWTNYSIKMAAFTIVGDGPWSDLLLEDTDEEIPYKPPANLTGEATSSTSIFVKWDPVVLPNIRGILRGYTVYYEEAPSSVHPSALRNLTVDMSVTDTRLVNLQKYTEYHIWLTAFTTREGLLSNSIFVRTHEDIPDRPPLYITYSFPSSTSMFLRWGPVPLQFKNGIIRGFKVEYQDHQPNAKAEIIERRLINWVLLTDLKKFTVYSVRVRAFTTIGIGPEYNSTVRTAQDVPSKPPNSINAESHVTLTTIPVTWQPIDPHHIHGVLLGYKVRYQAVAIGQEGVEYEPTKEERVGPTTLSFVLKNLEIFTLYRVDVLGYTIVGDGPPATDYAETCRCRKRLTTSWYEFPPYVQTSETNIPSGLIPPILRKLAVTCCETCQSHGTSYVDLNSNGFNQSAGLPDLRTLKSSIANPTDFFFPVYGFQDQTHFAKEFGYHGLVESPGMAYVINTNSQDDMPNAVLMNIFSCWPAVTLFMVVTYVAGLAVWAVESQYNPDDFPPSFIKGGPEGFYWAFVSMTTVGYGDRAPISIAGRCLAVFLILSGLVIYGLVNGIMASAITSVTLETDYKIYGAKVAAIQDTPEYRMGIRKNARMEEDHEYHTFEDIYTALREQKVIGALIDTYSAGSSKEMFEKEHLRVNKILDYSSAYGVVMGKEARKLRVCFHDFTKHAFANEIANHIQTNTVQLKESPDSLPLERSTGLFDSNSTVFQNTLLITSTLLILFLLLGIIYEVVRRLRARSKVQPHDLRQVMVAEMKGVVEHFNHNMNTIKAMMASKHKKEREVFLKSIMKHPHRKYASTAVLTDDLYSTPQYGEREATC